MRRCAAAVSGRSVAFGPLLVALVLGAGLAACGGHGGARSVLPGTPGSSSGGSTAPKSTNVALFNGELWYGAGATLLGVPLQAGGASAELDADFGGIVDAVPVAMTIAPDGTLYDLIADGETSWQLQAYAPGTFGAAGPEEVIAGSGYPQQVVLVGDGIDVLSTVNFNTANASSTLWTYAYGAGNRPQPIRTLSLGPNVNDVASDDYDRIYVARRGGAGISVYGPAAKCNCNPIRTIATGARSNDAIAISSDGIAYVLSKGSGGGAATIDAYAPGNDGPSSSRSIGPISASRGTPMGGITVDSDGKVYVNFKDARNRNSVDVYAPNANGAATPLTAIAAPTQGGYVTAIAIGPIVPAPAPVHGVLYVGNGSIVNAFALGANGAVAPQRSLTGLLGPDSPGGTTYRETGPMTATTDGRLYVARSTGPAFGSGDCSIAAESPSANGSAPPLFAVPCPSDERVWLGHQPNAILDVAAVNVSGSSPATTISRFGAPRGGPGDLTLPFPGSLFTTDQQGDIFIAELSTLYEYAPDAVTGASPIRRIDIQNIYENGFGAGAAAAGPDGTVYVLALSASSPNQPSTTAVYAYAPGTSPAVRFLPNGGVGAAIAVDSANELYVALNFYPGPSRSEVDVFGPNGLLRSVLNPVPAYTPITALSIFEQ
jgi:hypothetical protein